MFLKSLTLKGFKSFADSATLELEPGVTVVVGPNGSGKSNVVDAVAWVLGAQGPRTVRSSKMEDVIFAGTPKRPALGRAEVSLTIDNSSGLLPIEFSEVTITRTLFRSGDSEYAINKVPCRLLDIQDLLSDTGVGRQQHVIVSQGNLDTVLDARPEDRRAIIEEAAGILKFRKRKERSERRLQSTDASMTRLQDLLREVRRQLRPLEKQATAARRHEDLVGELRAIRRFLAGRELASIEDRLSGAARSRGELGRDEEQVRSVLSRLDTDVIAAEAEVDAMREAGSQIDLAEALSRAEGVRARARGVHGVLTERLRSLDRERSVTVDGSVISSLEAEAADLNRQLAATEQQADELNPRGEELASAEEALAADTEALELKWRQPSLPFEGEDGGQDDASLEPGFDEGAAHGHGAPSAAHGHGAPSAAHGHGAPSAADALAEAQQELRTLRSVTQRGRDELGRLADRAASVDDKAERLAAEVDRLRSVVTETEQRAPEIEAELAQARQTFEWATTCEREAAEARRQADADHHRWEARAEALSQALDEVRSRAGAERLSEVRGVVGALLEMVEVDEGWDVAFEAAAGDALAAVVVADPEAGRRALGKLEELGAGGAVAVLDVGMARHDETQLPHGCQWLRPRVRGRRSDVDGLLDALLGRAVVVSGGWSEAVAVSLSHPALDVVTQAGDRCAGGVWRTGATAAGVTGAALEEAQQAEETARVAAEKRSEEWSSASSSLTAARVVRDDASRELDANQSRRSAAADALARAERELSESSTEAADLSVHRAELSARLEAEADRIAQVEETIPALESVAAEEAERAAEERSGREQLAERARVLASQRRDFDVRKAGIEERRTVLQRRLAEVDERLERNVAEKEAAGERRAAIEAQHRTISRLLDAVSEHAAGLDQAVELLRAARREESEATRSRTEHLDRLRQQRGAAERRLTEIRERLSRIEVDEAEAKVRLEALVESVRRDLDCEPEATRGTECPELPPGTTADHRSRELERELRLMGPINPLALEEYEALKERNEFLEGQLEDVRSARRELSKVIKAIDTEIVEVFGAAWADVSENFTKLFTTLFPGGHGQLKLTDPEHLLDTGIEIEARPSGKNVRRLSLLSGGERSLTAMAYLFAVFRARPSPFYLMDEVEAALDDVNLHRFLDLLSEFRQEAQLLVVSHQKRTMEAADCLYGVTMAPGGSSKVVSEKVTADSNS